jgi:sulfhydrogenase subunit alpha
LDIAVGEYDKHFEETHEPHSHALHSKIRERGAYFTGPLARYNLNFDQLSPATKAAAQEIGFLPPCRNPFKSIIVRSLELYYACEEARRLVRSYVMPSESVMMFKLRAGTGYGCTEAPRGICYHRYQLDAEGNILDAKICPPTSQNQKQIESDLRYYVEKYIDLPKEKLTWQCEQAIRNYDPCISCATHYLKLDVEEV